MASLALQKSKVSAPVMANALLLLCLLICSQMVMASAERESRRTRSHRRRRERHLEFYMHDLVQARNPTAVMVIPPANVTAARSSFFGGMVVIDDKLTEGPDPKSREIGRAQGTYTFASLNAVQLFFAVTAVFHDDGSTLSFQGSDKILEVTRDISIVGGTGRFRFARGFATMRTYSIDAADAVIGLNCTITY